MPQFRVRTSWHAEKSQRNNLCGCGMQSNKPISLFPRTGAASCRRRRRAAGEAYERTTCAVGTPAAGSRRATPQPQAVRSWKVGSLADHVAG